MKPTFIQPCFIRKNTPELRKKLEGLGYKCLPSFTDFPCLATTQEGIVIPADMCNRDGGIDCGENEDLFLAVAALQADSDINQWFVYENTWFVCETESIEEMRNEAKSYYQGAWLYKSHKATVEELIEHFKKDAK